MQAKHLSPLPGELTESCGTEVRAPQQAGSPGGSPSSCQVGTLYLCGIEGAKAGWSGPVTGRARQRETASVKGCGDSGTRSRHVRFAFWPAVSRCSFGTEMLLDTHRERGEMFRLGGPRHTSWYHQRPLPRRPGLGPREAPTLPEAPRREYGTLGGVSPVRRWSPPPFFSAETPPPKYFWVLDKLP